MRRLALTVSLLLFIGGCAAVREIPPARHLTSPIAALSLSPYPQLKTGIDTLLSADLFPPSNTGIKIVSLHNREILYELNPDLLFTPASNQKLFTTAVALRDLGPGFTFSTRFLVDSASRMLFVKGYGDPLLSDGDLDSIASLLAPGLADGRAWSIAVDAGYFDDAYWGEGWTWDAEPYGYQAAVTPIALDLNTVTVVVEPALAAGSPPAVRQIPRTSYVTLENSAGSVPDTPVVHPPEISRNWRERGNTITITGDFAASQGKVTERVSVWRPDLYCGTVLAEKLRTRGVPVTTVTADSLRASARERLAFKRSLDTVLTAMNKESINLCAESLLKTVAAERCGLPGSSAAGISRMKLTLSGLGIDTTRIRLADGSGVSRYNLTSASAIIRLLEGMHADTALFPLFYHSLPVAGKDGTISRRMRGTAAEGNLRAKTGHLAGISCLSGYVQTADGELLAFSLLMQDFPEGGDRYRAVQNGIGTLLASLRRSLL